MLHDEAQYVQVQAVLVSKGRLCRYQKRKYKDVQGKLNDYWQQYANGKLSTSKLLRKSAYPIYVCVGLSLCLCHMPAKQQYFEKWLG